MEQPMYIKETTNFKQIQKGSNLQKPHVPAHCTDDKFPCP